MKNGILYLKSFKKSSVLFFAFNAFKNLTSQYSGDLAYVFALYTFAPSNLGPVAPKIIRSKQWHTQEAIGPCFCDRLSRQTSPTINSLSYSLTWRKMRAAILLPRCVTCHAVGKNFQSVSCIPIIRPSPCLWPWTAGLQFKVLATPMLHSLDCGEHNVSVECRLAICRNKKCILNKKRMSNFVEVGFKQFLG